MKKVLSILLSVMLVLSTLTCLMLVPASAETVGTVSAADGGYLVTNEDGTTTAKAYYGNTFVAWYNEADEVVSYNTTIGAVEENVVAKFNNYNLIPNGNFEEADFTGFEHTMPEESGVYVERVAVPGTNAGHGSYALQVNTDSYQTTSMNHALRFPNVTVEKNTTYVLRYSMYAVYEGTKYFYTTFQSAAAEALPGAYFNYSYECVIPQYSLHWDIEKADGTTPAYGAWKYLGIVNNTGKVTGPNTHYNVGVGSGKWVDIVLLFNTGDDISMFAEGADTGEMWFNVAVGNDSYVDVPNEDGEGTTRVWTDETPNFYVDNVSLTKVDEAAKAQMTVVSGGNGEVSGPAVANKGTFTMNHFNTNGSAKGESGANIEQHYLAGSATEHAQFVTNTGVYTATPDEGYTFIKWVDADGNTVSTKATDFLANDGTVTAVFAKGVAAAEGGYLVDNGATVTAKPYYGNTFLGWYDADDKLLTGGEWDTLTVTKENALGVTAKFNVYNLIPDGNFEANDGSAADCFYSPSGYKNTWQIKDLPTTNANALHGNKALYVDSSAGTSTAMTYSMRAPFVAEKNKKYIFHFSIYGDSTTNSTVRVTFQSENSFQNDYTFKTIPDMFTVRYAEEKADGSTGAVGSYKVRGGQGTALNQNTPTNVLFCNQKWADFIVVIDVGENSTIFADGQDTANCWFTIGHGNDGKDSSDGSPNYYLDNVSITEAVTTENTAVNVVAGENGTVVKNDSAKKMAYAKFWDTIKVAGGNGNTGDSKNEATCDTKFPMTVNGVTYTDKYYSNVSVNTGSYTATPDDEYTFLGWYVGDTLISTEATTDIYVEGSVVAKFAKGLGATDGGYLKDNGDGTVTAVAHYGNTFAGWYKNGKKLTGGEYDTYTVTTGDDKLGVSAVFNAYNQMVDGNFESADPNAATFYNTLAYNNSPIFKNNKVVELPANVTNENHGKYALWCEPAYSATASNYAASQRLVRIPLSLKAGTEYALHLSYYVPEIPVKPDGTALHADGWATTQGAMLSGDFVASRWTKYWKKESAAVPAGWCGHTHTNASFSVTGTSPRVQWAGSPSEKYGLWVDVYVLFTAANTEETYFDFGLINNCVSGFYLDNISVTEAATAPSTAVTATATAGGSVTQNETSILKFDHAEKNGSTDTDLDKYADYHVAGTTRYSKVAYRTYTATAEAGYKFLGWADASGNIVSTNATETFQTEGAYTAKFAAPAAAGKGGFLKDNGDNTVTAVAYYGNTFAGWSNGLTDATVNADDVLGATANFTVNNLVVDGSFENGMAQINDGVVGNVACDTFAQLGGNANILMSVTDAPESNVYGHGDKALYVDYNGYNVSGQDTNCYVLRTQNFPVEAGKKYVFSYSVYMQNKNNDSPSTTFRAHGTESYKNSWSNDFVPAKYTLYFDKENVAGVMNYYYGGYRINGGVNTVTWGGNFSTNIFGSEGWYTVVYLFEASATNEEVFFSIGSGNNTSSTNFWVDNVTFAEAVTTDPNADVNVSATPGGNAYAADEQNVGGYKFYNINGGAAGDNKQEAYDTKYADTDTNVYYSPVVANTYVAVADNGLEFTGWTKDGVAFGSDAKIEIAGNGNYVAGFDSIAQEGGLEGAANPNDLANAGNGAIFEYATYTEEQKAMTGYDVTMGDTYFKVTNTAGSNTDISIPVTMKSGVRYLAHLKLMVISSDVADPSVEWTEENPVGPGETSRMDFRFTKAANSWESFNGWSGKFTISGPNGTAGVTKAVEDEDKSWYDSWFTKHNQDRFGSNIVDLYYDITATEDSIAYITIGQWAGGEFGIDSFTVTEVSEFAPTLVGATFNPTADPDADAAMYVTNIDLPTYLAVSKVETFMGVAKELGGATDFNASTANVTTASLTAYDEVGYLCKPGTTEAFTSGDFYTTFTGASQTAQKVAFAVRSEITLTDCYGNDLGITLSTDVYSRSINQIKRLLAKSLGATADVYNNADVAVAWDYVKANAAAAQ